MTAQELFEGLAPRLAPMLLVAFGRRDLCVLATRVAIDVGAYFGVLVNPVPVQVVAYNAQFAEAVKSGDPTFALQNGGHSVGIGFGLPKGAPTPEGRWNGHLIATADGWFGDFAISQAERAAHLIFTGPAIVGPYSGAVMWDAQHDNGTTVEYKRTADQTYRQGPDWRDARRRRKITGLLIRSLNGSCR